MLRTGLIALLAVAFSGAAQAQAPAGPFVRAGATTKISEHAWTIPDNNAPGVPNVGLVVGERAILVIDTGMGAANGRTVLDEARKLAPGKRIYLVTTHVHPEHDLGAQAFPDDTVMIRARAQVNEIAEDGMRTADLFRGRSDANRQLLDGAAFRPGDILFDTALSLDLGGVTARLFTLGPAHTQGDTGVFVEGDKVLFSGDVAMKALPAFASSHSSVMQWLDSLDRLDALAPVIIVPSHGPVGDAAYIGAYRAYLVRVQSRAAALKREGKSLEQATVILSAELKADYADVARASGAIRAAYAEAP